MKNKIELKKTLAIILCIILLEVGIFSGVCYIEYRAYTNNFNTKIAEIIIKLGEKYPELTEKEIMEILNSKEEIKNSFLTDYGIDLKTSSIVLENDTNFYYFLLIDIAFLILSTSIIVLVFLVYNKNKDKKINEITKCIEQINNQKYKLDIEDNTEDELSILKNEVYKTTIMLKEVAENSKSDKLKLKDSLSDISHQLKTPLTSITILIDNIIENKDMESETRNEFAKDIKREITNINFLIQSLLKLSRLDVNQVAFINKKVYMFDLIDDSIKNLAALCDLKNIDIRVNGKTDSKIYCDLKWQTEAITNILKNCVEHSKENSVIDIVYEENEVYSKIEITDYGDGIDKEDVKHIFERFYKAKNSSPESVGIGLSLAKSIVQKNNGTISVTSKLNKGTTFVVKYFKYV